MSLLFLAARPAARSSELEYLRAHHLADEALVAGEWSEAHELFERCLELSPRNPTVAYGLACATSRRLQPHAALKWLRRAEEWGYCDADVAAWDPDLVALQGKPAFREVLEHMKAQAGESSPRLSILGQLPDTVGLRLHAGLANLDRVVLRLETGGLFAFDTAKARVIARLEAPGCSFASTRFSPSTADLFAVTQAGRVWRWQAPDYSRAASVSLDETGERRIRGGQLQIDAKGRRLLLAAWDMGAVLLDNNLESIERWGDWVTDGEVAWSPDGDLIAEAIGADLGFRDGLTGKRIGVPLSSPSEIHEVEFHPSGRWIATGHEDARVRIWDTQSMQVVFEDEIVDEIFGQPYFVNNLAFSPDGRWLAYSTGCGIRGVVLSIDPFARVWQCAHLGGWMCGPAELTWSAQSDRLWVRGPSEAVFEVGCNTVASMPSPARFACVTENTWIVTTRSGIAAYAAVTGRFLWHLAFVLGGPDEPGGFVHQAPSGHFRAEPGAFGALVSGEQLLRAEHGSWLTELYDPKRVRAAIAGVVLVDQRTLGHN